MAWTFKSGEPYVGDTHEHMGTHFTGKTRMQGFKPLVYVKEAPTQNKPRRVRPTPFKKVNPDG